MNDETITEQIQDFEIATIMTTLLVRMQTNRTNDTSNRSFCAISIAPSHKTPYWTYFVGIWPSICHRESSSTIVFVVWVEFVRKCHIVAPNRRFFPGDMVRIPSLHHESTNVSMEYRPVVLPGRSECEEVKGRPWARVAKDLAFQIPGGRMDSDRHIVCLFSACIGDRI